VDERKTGHTTEGDKPDTEYIELWSSGSTALVSEEKENSEQANWSPTEEGVSVEGICLRSPLPDPGILSK
jgi:hypothetical protein